MQRPPPRDAGRPIEPIAGQVIRYSYLWHDEAMAGSDEGTKDRPCAVVIAIAGKVVVVPITHRQPREGDGIEIPARTKQALGFDDERSWIVTSEVNTFDWPGPDIRRVPGGIGFVYGKLPAPLFARVLKQLQDKVRSRAARTVPRTQ